MTRTIEWEGYYLTVTGEYNRGYPETRETPSESASFEIHSIELEGVDITSLIERISGAMEEVEAKCIDDMRTYEGL